jgi:Ca-activated chloride channel family protein
VPLLESPSAFWLGLAVPAIILLWVLRPRRPRLRVPSIMLWPSSPAERKAAKPWQRLRNHPLLWIQLLLALLLMMAAARPFLPAEATARHLIVLLDASGSMRARDVEPDRFSAACAAVLELARGLGPGQEMTVLRLDERPRVLVAGARGVAQLEEALAAEEASFGETDVAAAIALATGLTVGPAEWVMVGDGGLALPENALRPAGTSYRFIPIGQPAGNVAVTGLSARRDAQQLVIQASVLNAGPQPVSGRLQLLAEGQLVSAREWQLDPGKESYITWSHLPTDASWYEVRLSGVPAEANALEQDDMAWEAIGVGGESEILLVTPGNSFLARVLGVQGGLRAFQAAPADWAGLVSQGASYPLTILDRTWPDNLPSGNFLLVGPPTGEEFRPGRQWTRPDHPLLRHVDWSEVSVASARKLPIDDSWETVIDSDGGPLLAIRTVGGRREAALAFDLSNSDLPLRPAFPVLIANLLDWLLPREDAPRKVLAGSELILDPSPLAQQIWVESPEGVRKELAPPWPPETFRPSSPGIYRVTQEWEGGRQQSLLLAGGFQPQEVDLTPRHIDLPTSDGTSFPPARGAFSLWPWIAAAILLLSLLEWWVDARGPEHFRRVSAETGRR